MRMWSLLTIMILAAAGLAGCAQVDDDGTDGDVGETVNGTLVVPVVPDQELFLDTVLNDHATGDAGHAGHQVSELHTGSENLELLGYSDLSEGLMTPSGGFTEVHVVGDLAVVASLTSQRGATLVDVSDPTDLQVLSHIYNLDDNWDAHISEDGRYLFIGCQGSSGFDCTGLDQGGETPEVVGGMPCTPLVGAPDPAPNTACPGGIAVYGIENPTNPSFEGYLPMGFTHNVFTFMVDGKYYFANAAGNIGEFDSEAGEFTLASTNITATHDIDVQQHPITGEWLLYTGSQHMSIWNVDDPFDPQIIGNVDPEAYDETIPAMWHEQTPMPCLIDGRHITIGAGESGGGVAQPVGVVDTTDPRNPVYLGKWQLPDAPDLTAQQNYRFSLHNIAGNCQGQVAIGHYHAGVWVFDVSTQERQRNPPTLAYYKPHEQALGGWSPFVTAPIGALVSFDTPNVWTAQWGHNGTVLFVPDMTTGLYALGPTWETETVAAQPTG